MPATGAVASTTVAVTMPLAIALATVLTGAAAKLGGFMQVPLVRSLGMTQVRPCPAQQAVVPLAAEVQPVTPMAVHAEFIHTTRGGLGQCQWPCQLCNRTSEKAWHANDRNGGGVAAWYIATRS